MSKNICDFFASFPKIYCISLMSSGERRLHMSGFVKLYGLHNFSYFNALSPSESIVAELYNTKKVKEFPDCFRCGKLQCGDANCNNTLIPAQVATFATYIELCKSVVRDNVDFALVIEDDIKLIDNASNACADLNKSDWLECSGLKNDAPALVQMGWALNEDHRSTQKSSLRGFMHKMSNPAFAINREMAKLILSLFERVDTTVDIFIHDRVANKQNAKTLFPPLFYEMSWSTGEVESTIHPKEVRLSFLQSNGASERNIAEAEEKLANHQKHTSVYPLLIVGHPRCGSGYSAELAAAIGLKVGHEKLLSDGISSWMFATDEICPWALNDGARTRAYKYFRHKLMHVRDPRTAISSIMRDNEFSEVSYTFRKEQIYKHFNKNLDDFGSNFTKAVLSYIYWNKLILKQQPDLIFRIEDEESKLKDYLLLNFDLDRNTLVEYPPKTVNANKKYSGKFVPKPDVAETLFTKLPVWILKELNELCQKFGYETFELPLELDKEKFFSQLENQTLQPTGWLLSAEKQISVDLNGEPMPWWTLPGIEFVNSILSNHWRVFEYGCGHSTLWWQKKVTEVIAVDHDLDWVNKIKPKLTDRNEIIFSAQNNDVRNEARSIADAYFQRKIKTDFSYDEDKIVRRGLHDQGFIDYADTINKIDGKFDCIVIDGMARRLCTHFAVNRLVDDGIIIFDNSNRSDYLEGYQYLVEKGFFQLRFSGPVAGATFPSCTSIFLKSLCSLPKIVFEPSMFGIQEY